MAQRKFYVVWVGREPGIYDNWDDCEQQVAMFPGARYKAFTSQTAATVAFRGSPDDQEAIVRAIADHNAASTSIPPADIMALKERFPEINGSAIAVDGACSGNPGPMEYQGVDLRTGERIFHFGPLDGGTNNAAEYLALVHALALLYNRNDSQTPIYSDSRIARSWIRNKGHRCRQERTQANTRLFELLDRADRWVQTHQIYNPILVWDTDRWGENPADFSRK